MIKEVGKNDLKQALDLMNQVDSLSDILNREKNIMC